MSVLSDRLSARIQELDIAVNEAARRCGIEKRSFAYYVTGERTPRPDTILVICKTLGITPNELFGFQPAPAELAPDEAALLEKYRALTIVQRTALLTLIAVSQDIAALPFTGT